MIEKENFRSAALGHGFDVCRFARAGRAPHAEALRAWLARGDHAGMEWMARTADERTDPSRLLPRLRSIVVLGTNYFHPSDAPVSANSTCGLVARYARGADYHDVLQPRLQALDAILSQSGGQQRYFTDSGPVLERDWADACGVSWHGKSTMGIHPAFGTWLFLSVILTTLDIEPDSPLPDRCGRCTRCIDACPTRAIVAPYRLDARRCISYLTIENKGPIPEPLREAVGTRIFGCDDCLDACPWNRFAAASRDACFRSNESILTQPLRNFLALDSAGFREMFRGSPVLRAKRRGFLRNVCVALGNAGTSDDLPALQRAMTDDEPLIREHAAWAVRRIASRSEEPAEHDS